MPNLVPSSRRFVCLTRASLLAGLLVFVNCSFTEKPRTYGPRLVVQVTVDALRGDLPFRYQNRFQAVKFDGEGKLVQGGFRYLMEKGAWYLSAHHPHAHTETVVGHTTLATGTYPSLHGIIGDSTFDRKSHKMVETIKDDQETVVGKGSPPAAPQVPAEELIQTGDVVAKGSPGAASPRRIEATAFSDELHMLTAGKAKIFSVSFKDRAAVPLAGKHGKAFWIDAPRFEVEKPGFVSSTYYYPKDSSDYPDWIVSWNESLSIRLIADYSDKSWELSRARDDYIFGQQDDRPFEIDVRGYRRVFPHPYGSAKRGRKRGRLSFSRG